MSDRISRQALCEYALNQKDKSITPNDIMRFPSAREKRTEKRTETHGVCLDTIDRQAVLDWLKKEWNGMVTSLFDGIKAMPSAEPDLDEVYAHAETEAEARFHAEIVRCRDCRYHKSDGCFFSTAETEEDGFCSWAERRTDGV